MADPAQTVATPAPALAVMELPRVAAETIPTPLRFAGRDGCAPVAYAGSDDAVIADLSPRTLPLTAFERAGPLGTPKVITGLPGILRAAFHGRIEKLFVTGDRDPLGTFDVLGDHVAVHEIKESRDEDLLNTAIAARALVPVLPGDQVPGGHDAAAILRY